MSEKIEKAFSDLVDAITEEARDGVNKAKAVGLPFMAGLFAQAVGAMSVAKDRFTETVSPEAKDPDISSIGLDEKKVAAIKALIELGQTDVVIGATVNVAPEVVALFRGS